MISSLKVLMKKLQHQWEIKKTISHLGYTEWHLLAHTCLKFVYAVFNVHIVKSAFYCYLFLWHFLSEYITSAICRSTASYNEIFTIYRVSSKWWKHATLDNLQQNKENVTWLISAQSIFQNSIQEILALLSNTRASFTREEVQIF